MHAMLKALNGPLEGSAMTATDGLIIGRDRTNRLPLDDRAVSRRHCQLDLVDSQFFLRDLSSSNGTLVNGIPITTRALKDQDQLRVGQTIFLFTLSPEDSTAVELSSDIVATSPTELSLSHSYPTEATLVKESAEILRLQKFLELGPALAGFRQADELSELVLRFALDSVPAQRAALLVFDPLDSEIAYSHYHSRDGQEQVMEISRTVISRVDREALGIMSNDVLAADGSMGDTVRRHQVSALLAAPMISCGQVIGALYLDTREVGHRFHEQHLKLLCAIASVATAPLRIIRQLAGQQTPWQSFTGEVSIQHDMVGSGARMRRVYEMIERVAPTDSTVLIQGESGTGKELVARAIHRNSARANKPFLAVNATVLKDELFESELFGHERGAFTSAVAQRKGKIELAQGGTLFLDEIGDLGLHLQVKLLRVLQEREFQRLGGSATIKADVRILAATNRDLGALVENGGFRQDLYYRLKVIEIETPPLRERKADVTTLAAHFIRKHAAKSQRTILGMSEATQKYLQAYDWPGNVRELENAVERAVVMGGSEWIRPEDLPEDIVESSPELSSGKSAFIDQVKAARCQIILKALEQTRGNHVEAAKLLELHPSNLHRLIRNLDLKAKMKK